MEMWDATPSMQLQWGHERALVEITGGSSHERTRYSLQWGHERALVEMWPTTDVA